MKALPSLEKMTMMISSTHLHAMVVHFPIALLITGFLFDAASLFGTKQFFRQFALYLLVLGMLGAIVSYIAGRAAGQGIEEGPLNKAMGLHEQAATLTLWLTIITAFLYAGIYFFKNNSKWLRIIATLLFLAVIGSIARTGYLGGQLVYQHGAGVELALPDFTSPAEK